MDYTYKNDTEVAYDKSKEIKKLASFQKSEQNSIKFDNGNVHDTDNGPMNPLTANTAQSNGELEDNNEATPQTVDDANTSNIVVKHSDNTTTGYSKIADAITNIVDGDTIILNVECTDVDISRYNPVTINVTLGLNGHHINGSDTPNIESEGNTACNVSGNIAINNYDNSKAAITIESANVTIKDSIGGSKLSWGTGYYFEEDMPDGDGFNITVSYEAEGACAIAAKDGANVIIESGIYMAGGIWDSQWNHYYDSGIPTIGCDASSNVTLAGGGYKHVYNERLSADKVTLLEGCYVVKNNEKYTGALSELSACDVRVAIDVIKSAYDKLIQASIASENGLIVAAKRIEVIAQDGNKHNSSTGAGAYSIGDTVTLKAYAKKGYKFLKWTTSPDSDENIKETREISFDVTEDTPEQWFLW